MKIAVISDVHGNLCALRGCLRVIEERRCDRLISLGDVFGYYPDGVACLEALNLAGAELLMGNHEAMLLGLLPCPPEKDEVYQLGGTFGRLGLEQRKTLQGLVPYKEVLLEGKRLLFAHGSPWDPLQGYVYPDTDLEPFADLEYHTVFMGHTHHPFVSQPAPGYRVINVGSCGLPRDIGTMSAFAIFDVLSGDTEVLTVEFDRDEVLASYPSVHYSVKQCLTRHK